LWFDRLGRQSGAVGGADTAAPVNPELSSDGRRVALDRFVGGNRDIWLLETERGGLSRFTFDPAVDIDPIWSPEGSRIVFASNRRGVNDLYQKPASGADRDELLLESSEHKRPQHFSPDGRFLLYRVFGDATGWDLWALPLEGDRPLKGHTPFPVAQTPFDERDGQFSPDGKWIAYRSDESGRLEVYVQAFPQPAGKWRASVNGGSQPRWRSDGRELFYVDLDNTLMSVRLKAGLDGRVEADTQAALFPTHILQTAATGLGYEKQQYAVSSDGQRFLINSALDENLTAPIVLILNWRPPATK
jgi:Tol biopolymer transport system component